MTYQLENDKAIWSKVRFFQPIAWESWSRKLTPGLRIRAVRILTTMSTFFNKRLNWSLADNLKTKTKSFWYIIQELLKRND